LARLSTLVIPEMVSGVGSILQRVLLIQAFAWHITGGVWIYRHGTPVELLAGRVRRRVRPRSRA
jgi:hypothetical protein